ncbi:hypothetical protein [Kordiimonas aestuarii]|uniref:hypothetical protein n=1 Tax=Kordiimonas aestuarii TaxID=1005925 RepID=UPI0021D28201|nr:hypothetical protein [Kordiimonas aestuarii]
MPAKYSFKRSVAIAAGLSLSSLMLAGAGNAMVTVDDEGGTAEKAEKAEKKIRIVKAGEPAVVIHKNATVRSAKAQERAKAIEEAEEALEKVEKRLEKAKKIAEREALEAAEDGLRNALDALKSADNHMAFAYSYGPSMSEMREIEIKALEDALEGMEDHFSALSRVRIEIQGDLADAREDIADALADIEIEVDIDDELRKHHYRGLEEAAEELGHMEGRQLEGLKHVEEQLKRERERLEKRLEERRQRQAEEDARTPESR